MKIFETLLPTLPEAVIHSVTIGLHWTAVVVERGGRLRCGLASTVSSNELEHGRQPSVAEAGKLEQRPALKLAHWVFSQSPAEVGVGLATINALLPPVEKAVNLAAEDYIASRGADKQVALIGHFPFVPRLKEQVKKLWVLELNPKGDDHPAVDAPEILPQADILAITSMTLINHTFDGIFALRKPGAKVLLLGPSTPLSPLLFELGIHVLSGSIVEDIDAVLPLVRQGATFRQIHHHGIRLVTIEEPV